MEGIKMKRYKLLKDMPTIKAGTVFVSDGTYVTQVDCDTKINIEDILDFNGWFEEVKEFEEWTPKYNSVYKYMNTIGKIYEDVYLDDEKDKCRLSIRNCYPENTPDEVIIKEQKLIPQALYRLKMAAKKAWFEFDGSDGPDWDDSYSDKVSIFYNFYDKTFGTSRVKSCKHFNEIYFPTKDSAQWVIDNMRDDLKLVMGIE